jgi:hypothetical protein
MIITPHLGRIEAALMTQRCGLLASYWDEAKAALLGPVVPFRALAYDVLDKAVPLPVRARYGLSLERPQAGA